MSKLAGEIIGRAAMVVLAGMLLAGGGGILYAAWLLLSGLFEQTKSVSLIRTLPMFLIFGAIGLFLAWAGLFFLKRAVVPSRWDERLPRPPGLWEGPDVEEKIDRMSRWTRL